MQSRRPPHRQPPGLTTFLILVLMGTLSIVWLLLGFAIYGLATCTPSSFPRALPSGMDQWHTLYELDAESSDPSLQRTVRDRAPSRQLLSKRSSSHHRSASRSSGRHAGNKRVIAYFLSDPNLQPLWDAWVESVLQQHDQDHKNRVGVHRPDRRHPTLEQSVAAPSEWWNMGNPRRATAGGPDPDNHAFLFRISSRFLIPYGIGHEPQQQHNHLPGGGGGGGGADSRSLPFTDWLQNVIENPAIDRVDLVLITEYLPRSLARIFLHRASLENTWAQAVQTALQPFKANNGRLVPHPPSTGSIKMYDAAVRQTMMVATWLDRLRTIAAAYRRAGATLSKVHVHEIRAESLEDKEHRLSVWEWFRDQLQFPLPHPLPKRMQVLDQVQRTPGLVSPINEFLVLKGMPKPKQQQQQAGSENFGSKRHKHRDDKGSAGSQFSGRNQRRQQQQEFLLIYHCLIAYFQWLGRQSHTVLRDLPPLPHLAQYQSAGEDTRLVVAITQVRNVAHTIHSFLESLRGLADKVLLLDNGSSDRTVAVVQEIADTDPKWHGRLAIRVSGTAKKGLRQQTPIPQQTQDQEQDEDQQPISMLWHEGSAYHELLTWARSEKATHILCPDSDEYITANWKRHGLLRYALYSLPRRTGIATKLFHVYNGTNQWIAGRPPGWQQATSAPLGWRDDGESHRANGVHHIKRMPNRYRVLTLGNTQTIGAVHFKFASLQAIHVKTVWYRHLEYDSGSKSRALGDFYRMKIPTRIRARHLQPVPRTDWFDYEAATAATPNAGDQDAQSQDGTAWTIRWTEPESWLWRVDMVQNWRKQWQKQNQAVPKALGLPRNWNRLVRLAERTQHLCHSGNTNTSTTGGAEAAEEDRLDKRCRAEWMSHLFRTGSDQMDRRQPELAKALSSTIRIELPALREPLPGFSSVESRRFLWAVAPDQTMVRWLHNHEVHVRAFAHHVMHQLCAVGSHRNPSDPELWVLDIGANSGYYGLMGLTMGCARTVFVEPQPYCSMLIQQSLNANGWNQSADLIRAAAGPRNQAQGIQVWCDTPCYGRVGAPGVHGPTTQMPGVGAFLRKGKRGNHGTDRKIADAKGWRPMVRIADHAWLQSVVTGRAEIALLKIDVEGAEADVMQGLRPLFEQRAIHAATIEVTPQFYRQWGKETAMRQAIYAEFRPLFEGLEYEVWVPDHKRKQGQAGHAMYRKILNSRDLETYLLREPFNQHDLFLLRSQPPGMPDLHLSEWMQA